MLGNVALGRSILRNLIRSRSTFAACTLPRCTLKPTSRFVCSSAIKRKKSNEEINKVKTNILLRTRTGPRGISIIARVTSSGISRTRDRANRHTAQAQNTSDLVGRESVGCAAISQYETLIESLMLHVGEKCCALFSGTSQNGRNA